MLSNDSFQEFHAEHPWLFDEGRLIGGKPVPRRRLDLHPAESRSGARSRRRPDQEGRRAVAAGRRAQPPSRDARRARHEARRARSAQSAAPSGAGNKKAAARGARWRHRPRRGPAGAGSKPVSSRDEARSPDRAGSGEGQPERRQLRRSAEPRRQPARPRPRQRRRDQGPTRAGQHAAVVSRLVTDHASAGRSKARSSSSPRTGRWSRSRWAGRCTSSATRRSAGLGTPPRREHATC